MGNKNSSTTTTTNNNNNAAAAGAGAGAGASATAATATIDSKEPEVPKVPVIPVDPLCVALDPFIDNKAEDKFMRHQYEIDYSDILDFPDTDTGYSVSNWRRSKELMGCKMYYKVTKKTREKKALLVSIRAAVSDADKNARFIQVNLIDMILNAKKDDNSKNSNSNSKSSDSRPPLFDPSNKNSLQFRTQYLLECQTPTTANYNHATHHYNYNHANVNCTRHKTQLHPKKPWLFVFSRNRANGYNCIEMFDLLNIKVRATKAKFNNNTSANSAQVQRAIEESLRESAGNGKSQTTTFVEPNQIFTFQADYYLQTEMLELNDVHFVSKKINNKGCEYLILFHKPSQERNINSGSKFIVFANTWTPKQYKQSAHNVNTAAAVVQYKYNVNFNAIVTQTLAIGQTFHHNLVDIYSRDSTDPNILISFRIHKIDLNAQTKHYDSFSEIFYIQMNLSTGAFSDIKKFGFDSLQFPKATHKETNCVESIKFSTDGKFFAIIKQREFNNESLFRMYKTGESDEAKYLCQMTNIDINPWMIVLKSFYSHEFGYFFTVSHLDDHIEKAWIIIAGPNIHGDLQTYREILREFLYDDAISVVINMIGLSHRYTLHLDIGYLAGEQMADYDYNEDLGTMVMAIDDACYILFQN